MTLEKILQVCASIIVSLGGGAAIIAGATQWCSNYLLSKLQMKQERDLEKYKSELEQASSKLNTLLSQSLHIAQQQYDAEVGIYKELWLLLHEITECLNYIPDFKRGMGESLEAREALLSHHCNDFSTKLIEFRRKVDCSAPFYQEDIFNLLKEIEEHSLTLASIFNRSKGVEGFSNQDDAEAQKISNQIGLLKTELTSKVRNYLRSLNTIT